MSRTILILGGYGNAGRAVADLLVRETQIPTLREAGFFVAGFDTFTDYVAIPASIAFLRLVPSSALSVGRFFRWSVSRVAKPPLGLVLQLDARGTKTGKKKRMLLRLSHEDGYFFTAVPVVVCLKQYLSGSIRIAGLHWQANLVEPVSFLRDIQKMGTHFEEVPQC